MKLLCGWNTEDIGEREINLKCADFYCAGSDLAYQWRYGATSWQGVTLTAGKTYRCVTGQTATKVTLSSGSQATVSSWTPDSEYLFILLGTKAGEVYYMHPGIFLDKKPIKSDTKQLVAVEEQE